jgi:signal transduction histidine kinase
MAAGNNPKRRSGTPIRARLFLAVGLPVAVLVTALGVFAWLGARAVVTESTQRELSNVAAIAAAGVNPAPARFLLPGDKETRTYKRLVTKLGAIQKATGSSRVLLVGADEKVRADGEGSLDLFGPAPRLALDRAEFARALAGEIALSIPYEDDSGRRYLAAYAKVPDRDDAIGEPGTAMVLAIEAPAELLDLTDEVAAYFLFVGAFGIALVFLVAALVARTISAPVLRLADEAEKLGRGRLHQPLWVPPRRDEVALLGRTLEDMRLALNDRDTERQMMLAGIAHEVRNPLGGMELFSGLLAESIDELATEPGEEGQAWLPAELKGDLSSHAGRVRKELRYLTGVVNDFLAFARDLPLHRERVRVSTLLEDVRSLRVHDGLAVVKVECEIDGKFALDRSRIKEALLNLVANAQQASPDDGEVILRARIDDEEQLVLEVEDQGRGMEPQTVERAFAPFFTTKEKGSGLGLPLVRKFARDHGGDASIESTPGEGTRITLVLAPGEPGSPGDPDAEPRLLGDGEEVSERQDPPEGLLGEEPGLLGDDEEPELLGDDEEPELLGDDEPLLGDG